MIELIKNEKEFNAEKIFQRNLALSEPTDVLLKSLQYCRKCNRARLVSLGNKKFSGSVARRKIYIPILRRRSLSFSPWICHLDGKIDRRGWTGKCCSDIFR